MTEPNDRQRTEERRCLIDAWRRFEASGDAKRLLEDAHGRIASRCATAARSLDLDRDDVINETCEVLLRRKLHKKPCVPCVNDDHCLGRFGAMVRHALLDAIRKAGARRKQDRKAEETGELDEHEPPEATNTTDRYIEQEQTQYNTAQLYRCLREAVTRPEAKAVVLTHLTQKNLLRSEIASRLGIVPRTLQNRLNSASKKLLSCLKRYGVEL